MTTDVNKFDKRDNKGTAICSDCGKRTWESRIDRSTGLCPDCYSQAGMENEHVDGHHDANPNPDCPFCSLDTESEEEEQQHDPAVVLPVYSGEVQYVVWQMFPTTGKERIVGEYDDQGSALDKWRMLMSVNDSFSTYQVRTNGGKIVAKAGLTPAEQGKRPTSTKRQTAAEATASSATTTKEPKPKAEPKAKREPIVQTWPNNQDAFITRRNQVAGHLDGITGEPIAVGEVYERLQRMPAANDLLGVTLPKGEVHYKTATLKNPNLKKMCEELAAKAAAAKPKAEPKAKAVKATEPTNDVVAEAEQVVEELEAEPAEA